MRRLVIIGGLVLMAIAAIARPACAADPSPDEISGLVKQLDSDSYHSRQRANKRLFELGRKVIPAVVQAADGENLEVTFRSIGVLKQLGKSDDLATEDAAFAALAKLTQSTSGVVSNEARRVLGFLKEGQHKRTIARIKEQGGEVSNAIVYLGGIEMVRGNIVAGPNGLIFEHRSEKQPISVTIGPKWTGGAEGLSLLHRLQSISMLTLEGDKITDASFAALRGLDNLQSLSIKRTKITDVGLAHVATLKTLQTLEVFHSPVTDTSVKQLGGLSKLLSAKFYGTKLSPQGAETLAKLLPNAKIDRRSGALLGVSASLGSGPCVISTVQPGSAAHKGGIREDDIIVRFNDKTIADFTELTAAIADKVGGDKVVIAVLREGASLKLNVTLGEWK